MIEFRAERGFSSTENLLRDPELFTTRRAEAEHAAEIVNRIRIDEAVHVHSLRLYLGELRTLDFKTVDGGTISGRDVVDTFWEGIVKWATIEQPPLAAAQQKQVLLQRIAAHPEAARVTREFLALEDAARRGASSGKPSAVSSSPSACSGVSTLIVCMPSARAAFRFAPMSSRKIDCGGRTPSSRHACW